MHPTLNEQASGLRAEIKRHREQNRRMRVALHDLKTRPIGRRDPIAALKLENAIANRLFYIRQAEKTIAAMKGN